MTIIMTGEDGKLADKIVEKMFSDLYHGTHIEDQLTMDNFLVYLDQLYDIRPAMFPGFMPAGIHVLLQVAIKIGTHLNLSETDDGRYAARFPHWPENKYVMHKSIPIVLSLAICQHMRDDIASHLNTDEAKH